jgi:hypothetical protein
VEKGAEFGKLEKNWLVGGTRREVTRLTKSTLIRRDCISANQQILGELDRCIVISIAATVQIVDTSVFRLCASAIQVHVQRPKEPSRADVKRLDLGNRRVMHFSLLVWYKA